MSSFFCDLYLETFAHGEPMRTFVQSPPVFGTDMYGWPGIDVQLAWQSERTGIENKWYALTGRVVAVRVEADGDLHIALQDARLATSRELSSVKYRQNRNGVRFVVSFLVGRGLDSLC